MDKKKLVLFDDVGNDVHFESLGCVEVNGEFYELLAHSMAEYCVVWPHDEGTPENYDDLMARCAYWIDMRDGERSVIVKNTDEEYAGVIDEVVSKQY